jgi:hypothetical protein
MSIQTAEFKPQIIPQAFERSDAAMRSLPTHSSRIAHSPIISSHPPRLRARNPVFHYLRAHTNFLRNDNSSTTVLRHPFLLVVDRQYVLVARPCSLVGNRKRMRMRSFAPALPVLDPHIAL